MDLNMRDMRVMDDDVCVCEGDVREMRGRCEGDVRDVRGRRGAHIQFVQQKMTS